MIAQEGAFRRSAEPRQALDWWKAISGAWTPKARSMTLLPSW
jgi:hypothetical protein